MSIFIDHESAHGAVAFGTSKTNLLTSFVVYSQPFLQNFDFNVPPSEVRICAWLEKDQEEHQNILKNVDSKNVKLPE